MSWPRPQVSHLSETTFDCRAPDGDLPASCPTIDLSATWDEAAQTLLICRPPGQVVSKIHQQQGVGGRAAPCALAWKPDGQFIAVGWNDGFVRLMSLENSKAAHHLAVTAPSSPDGKNDTNSSSPPPAAITRIAWASNRVFADVPGGSRSQNQAAASLTTTQQSLGRILRAAAAAAPAEAGIGGGTAGAAAAGFAADGDGDGDAALSELDDMDLPTELAFLEVDASLPKISPLPSGSAGPGADALVFTSRTGIEFLFQPLRREDTMQVHVMLVGTDDGSLHVSICDSFTVGTFPPSAMVSSTSTPAAPRLLSLHASHPDASTHALLLRSASDPTSAYLAPMDLPFVASSPANLALMASRLTTLQKLLRYLVQAQLHMQLEYKNTRELPVRFLRGIQEDLAARATRGGARGIVQALYHTAVTGHLGKVVKEWLVDSVSERGHKRWDKAVKSGLENLRGLVHENLLPALDRAATILSRLRGLALFHSSSPSDGSALGFSADQVARIADAAAALALIGHRILLLVMEELDLFAVFSAWLRIRIDRAASTQAPDDATQEKEASIETGKVLAYIQRYLIPTVSPSGGGSADAAGATTPLGVFLEDLSTDEVAAATAQGVPADSRVQSLPARVDEQIRRIEKREPFDRALPRIVFLVSLVTSRADAMFAAIADTQRSSVRFGKPTRLGMATRGTARTIGGVDAAMAVDDGEDEDGTRLARVHVAMTPKERENELWLFETALRISQKGVSETVGTRVCPLTIPGVGSAAHVLHAKFLNDKMLLVLFKESKDASSLRLLTLPLSALAGAYVEYSERTASAPRPSPLENIPLVDDDGRPHSVGLESLCVDLPTDGGNGSTPSDDEDPVAGVGGSAAKGKGRARARPTNNSGPLAAVTLPLRMETHDVSEVRGRVPARVCLLAPGGMVWTTFALELQAS